MGLLSIVLKRARIVMAKRKKKVGKSSRRGNLPSPYQKYGKVPYRYSTAYYEWFNRVRHNRAGPSKDWKSTKRTDKYQRTYLEAAE
jgi:hypothetical protein